MSRDIKYIEQLRQFNGSTEKFWVNFLNGTASLVDAQIAFLVVKNQSENNFDTILTYNEKNQSLIGENEYETIHKLAESSLSAGHAYRTFKNSTNDKSFLFIAVSFELEKKENSPIGVYYIESTDNTSIGHTLWRLKALSNSPAFFQYKNLLKETFPFLVYIQKTLLNIIQ